MWALPLDLLCFGKSKGTNQSLDSGTTISQFSSARYVWSIWEYVGATPYDDTPTSAYIPCSAAQSGQQINFQLAGITIPVPISQLVIGNSDANQYCQFGISIARPELDIFGDTVRKYAL
jgi:hypothetical protein